MAENATSYLTILLTDNENLKNYLTAYLNIKLSMEATYDKVETDLTKIITPEEKKQLTDTISYFRAYATRIKVSIDIIKSKFSVDAVKDIDESYLEISTKALPSYAACLMFVQTINNELNKQLKVSATFTTNN